MLVSGEVRRRTRRLGIKPLSIWIERVSWRRGCGLRLADGGDELLVIPLGLSREVSGWWNGWIGRDPEEDEEWRRGGIDGTAPLKIRVGSLFIADGFLGMC